MFLSPLTFNYRRDTLASSTGFSNAELRYTRILPDQKTHEFWPNGQDSCGCTAGASPERGNPARDNAG